MVLNRKDVLPKSPASDSNILLDWKQKYRDYIKMGYRKWRIYQRIASEAGFSSASTVQYWLEEEVRIQEIERKKNYKLNRKTKKHRLRNSTRMSVYRHIAEHVERAFEGSTSTLLSLDQIIIRISQNLIRDNKPGIIIKPRTLLKYLNINVDEKEQKRITKVKSNDFDLYKLNKK